MKFSSKSLILGVAATATFAGLGSYISHEEHRPAVLEIFIFALKSGRSVFIRTPDDKRILIDGGANADVIRELTRILPFYSRRIDTIIATNSDARNVTGLIDVASRYDVEDAYVPAYTSGSLGLASSTDQIYSTLLETLASKKISRHEVKAGDSIILGKNVSVDIIFPVPPDQFEYSKSSPPELFMRISCGSTSFALLGDASRKIQKFIATSSPEATDVMYVSQGAAEDVSPELMGEMNPTYFVYSKNVSKTGSLPPKILKKQNKISIKKVFSKSDKKEMVAAMAEFGAEVRLNLKEKGTAHFVSDGSTISLR